MAMNVTGTNTKAAQGTTLLPSSFSRNWQMLQVDTDSNYSGVAFVQFRWVDLFDHPDQLDRSTLRADMRALYSDKGSKIVFILPRGYYDRQGNSGLNSAMQEVNSLFREIDQNLNPGGGKLVLVIPDTVVSGRSSSVIRQTASSMLGVSIASDRDEAAKIALGKVSSSSLSTSSSSSSGSSPSSPTGQTWLVSSVPTSPSGSSPVAKKKP